MYLGMVSLKNRCSMRWRPKAFHPQLTMVTCSVKGSESDTEDDEANG